MSFVSRVVSMWRNVVRHSRAERDLDDEVREVFDLLVHEKSQAGLSPESARRSATLEFGGVELSKAQVRDVRAGAAIEGVLQDLRYAGRLLRRNPRFGITAIASLAVGIGINSAVFTVARAALLKSWPGSAPERLVSIEWLRKNGSNPAFSYAEYRDLNDQSHTFAGVLACSRHVKFLRVGSESQAILYDLVSPNYFKVLGIRPVRGRTFESDEGHEDAVVIGDSLWRRTFAANPSIIGQRIVLSGRAYSVVGVMPRGFRGLDRMVPTELWLETTSERSNAELSDRRQREFELLGRLGPGNSPTQARAELALLGRQIVRNSRDIDPNNVLTVVSGSERLREAIVPATLLMAAVGLVLLISCANVAGLILARSEARRKETALRLALGASPSRLMRQLLTESALLAMAGAVAGLLVASLLLRLQPVLMPPLPFQFGEFGLDLRMDGWVIAFTVAISAIAVLAIGLAPALQAARSSLVAGLKGDRSRPAHRPWLRSAFAAIEVALAAILITASVLLVRSLLQSQTIPLGIDVNRQILLFEVLPGAVDYDAQRSLAFLTEIADRVRSIPGVERASLALRVPLSASGGGAERDVEIPGQLPGGQTVRVKFNAVDPDYFVTLSTRVLRGRTFARADSGSGLRSVVISETMARRFWPGADAIGRQIIIGGLEHDVVGVVEDVKINDVHEPSEPYMYLGLAEAPSGEGTLIVRTTTKADLGVIDAVRDRIHSLDANVPISVRSMDDVLASALWQDRTAAAFVAVLGMLGLFLAAVGLSGVIAQGVARRTHEIGVRMALGADRRAVLQPVLTQALRLAVVGISAGLVAALGVTRFMSSLLYGIRPTDPLSFAFSGGVVLLVTIVATWLPAARAVKVDPIVALRFE